MDAQNTYRETPDWFVRFQKACKFKTRIFLYAYVLFSYLHKGHQQSIQKATFLLNTWRLSGISSTVDAVL